MKERKRVVGTLEYLAMINARRTSLSRRTSLETATMQPRTYYAKMQSPDNHSGVIAELNLTYLYNH